MFFLLNIFIEHLTVYTLIMVHENYTKRDMLYIYMESNTHYYNKKWPCDIILQSKVNAIHFVTEYNLHRLMGL